MSDLAVIVMEEGPQIAMFSNWLKYPLLQKKVSQTFHTITRGKKFLKETSFQVRDGPVKRTETRQG